MGFYLRVFFSVKSMTWICTNPFESYMSKLIQVNRDFESLLTRVILDYAVSNDAFYVWQSKRAKILYFWSLAIKIFDIY